MAIINTSNVIDSSIFLKAKLNKNMVGDNYYIENLQEKRDKDWEFRYNVVSIEEELEKQVEYTQDVPNYTPIDVVIRNVKSIKGEEMGTDWANISFKDLKHPCGEGYRYRFSLDFPDMSRMDEEEKHFSTSIWLGVNKTPVKAGNTLMLRRCTTALTLVGSPNKSYDYITEVHQEPCILENEMKYMQVYYNEVLPVPQAEWYATMQLNYFSNQIKINDRFLFGTIDAETRGNNSVYKVKAVIKSNTEHTFVKDHDDEMVNTTLMIIALDKDEILADDDLENRIAVNAPIYKTYEEKAIGAYTLIPSEYHSTIFLGESEKITYKLYYNEGEIKADKYNYSIKIENIKEENWQKYYDVIFDEYNNSITIKNLKACNRGNLILTLNAYNSQEVLLDSVDVEIKLASTL